MCPFQVITTSLISLQSCEGLHRDEAGYPDYVELSAKYHALETIEVSWYSYAPVCTLGYTHKESSILLY